MRKTRLAIAACLFGMLFNLHSQGYIVPNGVTTNYIPGSGEISVIYNPTSLYYTGFFLNSIGKTLPTVYTNTFSYSVVLDVGVRVFLVSSNDPISLQPILSQTWTELGGAPSYIFNNGVPFYVGVYTGNVQFAPLDGIYNDPLFGWALLVNNRGTIQVLDYAVEYGGAGIFAGTQNIIQPVPEPSVLALVGLGGLILACRRWRKELSS